jgi:hypothetical protein
MRPRVHKYLANRLSEVTLALHELPSGLQAREMGLERANVAMKFFMMAEICTKREERTSAAQYWWAFRRTLRKAEFFYACAQIVLHLVEGGSVDDFRDQKEGDSPLQKEEVDL